VRAGNEDGFFVSADDAIFAVADGMGGHERGEIASSLTLETIGAQATVLAQAAPSDLPTVLHDTIQQANQRVLDQQPTEDADRPMGTTLVLAAINGDRLYFAHIGDSRLYLLRGDVFTQLTRDHSLVQMMVDRGEITPDEAAIHPLRHQITRVVGGSDQVSPEIASQALVPGDHLLLCTDGLSGVVPVESLKAILGAPRIAQEKADALVTAALEAGGPDNVTAIVIAYQRPRPVPEATATPVKSAILPRWQGVLITLLSLTIVLTSAGFWLYLNPEYYIGIDAQHRVDLFQRWPLLPMLEPQRAPNKVPTITVEEVKSHWPEIATLERNGLTVKSRDAGERFLEEKAEAVGNALVLEAAQAIDAKDAERAHRCLSRAGQLGADPKLVEAQVLRLKALLRTEAPKDVINPSGVRVPAPRATAPR
jgi:serine/threonine protein phosphatase PrpC